MVAECIPIEVVEEYLVGFLEYPPDCEFLVGYLAALLQIHEDIMGPLDDPRIAQLNRMLVADVG